MATYIVGDLQGCFDELQLLLQQVEFNPTADKLYLVGDLVARGDQSLECLRFVKSLGAAAQTVLGNHDLHLLATAYGIKKVKAKDRVDALFAAPDFNELIDWLRHQPLLIDCSQQQGFVITHAGISPEWDLATAKQCAHEVEQVLQQGDYKQLLTEMYSDQPDHWEDSLSGIDRLRYSINVFTRMRYCFTNKHLEFACKLPPAEAPDNLKAWFELTNPLYQQTAILFGHWASLIGYPTPKNIYALDTGCVWGNYMTMLRWEDKQFFTQTAIKDYIK
ncbi:bis(5'-nucleosyl)-tetraphosphatase (symmetrical) ApaH [Gallibacterium salpingitidis]|uniref:Bis(5'-nucleosyl)-tetraphosphatase, symmetrical n=1 Tax=Gallibacterium salpingitidis TaxID=505341 RepID=A0A1A7P2N4_9PAST|nr:bis(5'-nucleosyl)-tetraphosphatase (symmetrical) ApaH [Gallibacterium salpingitidis]OBW96090.1 diadenosine tetraphosphatase [Gallibacterium salpingitidis]